MILERFRGNPETGDIDTKDNKILNFVVLAGALVTLGIIFVLLSETVFSVGEVNAVVSDIPYPA